MKSNDLAPDIIGVGKADRAHRAQLDHLDDLPPELPAQHVIALLADAQELDRFALAGKRVGRVARKSCDRRVEGAAEAALCRADGQEVSVIAPSPPEQRRTFPVAAIAAARLAKTCSMRSA